MKEGKYFQIPEGPADIERLWEEAKPLEPTDLPTWLAPEDASTYRYIGSTSWANLLARDREHYFAELEEIGLTGLIVEQDPDDSRVHHVYIAAPAYEDIWAIGIYVGDSPFSFMPQQGLNNPVLTREDVSDVQAVFVADPFMLRVNDTWHMFFEVMNWRANKGEIGLTTSKDGVKWTYQQIVLAEPFHLSYPYVFEWMNDYYMIPESYQASSIRLYKALTFPTRWSFVGTLLEGPYLVDASICRYDDKWWLFTETNPDVKHDTLRLYYAADLMGPWLEHPMSPIIEGNAHVARPGGKVLVINNKVIRYTQNCYPYYGTEVRAFEITELTTVSYNEREIGQNPVLMPSGNGWNACGMHHIDAHLLDDGRWIACADGWSKAGMMRKEAISGMAKSHLAG